MPVIKVIQFSSFLNFKMLLPGKKKVSLCGFIHATFSDVDKVESFSCVQFVRFDTAPFLFHEAYH